jgi:hypothetical protein
MDLLEPSDRAGDGFPSGIDRAARSHPIRPPWMVPRTVRVRSLGRAVIRPWARDRSEAIRQNVSRVRRALTTKTKPRLPNWQSIRRRDACSPMKTNPAGAASSPETRKTNPAGPFERPESQNEATIIGVEMMMGSVRVLPRDPAIGVEMTMGPVRVLPHDFEGGLGSDGWLVRVTPYGPEDRRGSEGMTGVGSAARSGFVTSNRWCAGNGKWLLWGTGHSEPG